MVVRGRETRWGRTDRSVDMLGMLFGILFS
jgi:hypothetical protein